MTATATLAPSPLRSWLTGALFALIAFGICWTGTIACWRARAGDPGAVEILFYLLVLPGALLAGALVMRARLANAARADRMPARDQAPQPTAPSIQILPLAILDTAIRSPHGTSVEEVADALAGKQARPALDATLVDEDGFPLMTARCPEAADDALQTDLAAWLAASTLPDDLSDAQRRALVLATCVAGELAAKAASAMLQAEQPAPVLQLAPVLPADWTSAQRHAASQWLQHTVAENGWPLERIALVAPMEADLFSAVPAALLAQLATRVPGTPVHAMIVACASHLDDVTVRDWAASQSLFTSSQPDGQIPGEGAIGLLLADVEQAATLDGALFAVLDPVASAHHATSADTHRGAMPPVLAGLAQGALAAAKADAAGLTMIVADTGPRTSRMLELMGYAGSAAPHLDNEKDVILFGRPSGVCGAVPALTALALARHHACLRNGPVLWLANDDPFQRCAAVVMPPASL